MIVTELLKLLKCAKKDSSQPTRYQTTDRKQCKITVVLLNTVIKDPHKAQCVFLCVSLWDFKSSSYLLLHYIESFGGSKGQFFNGVLLNYQVGAPFITHRLDPSTWTKQAAHAPLKIPLKQKSGVICFNREGLAIKYRIYPGVNISD